MCLGRHTAKHIPAASSYRHIQPPALPRCSYPQNIQTTTRYGRRFLVPKRTPGFVSSSHHPQAEEKKRKYIPTAKHSAWQGVRPRPEERATPSAVVVSLCSSTRLYGPRRKPTEHPRRIGGLPQSLRKQKQIKPKNQSKIKQHLRLRRQSVS